MSALRGIEVRGNHWHLRGLEIENAADNGIAISGSHNLIEDVVLHNNGDTGLQITVGSAMATDDAYAAYNVVLNGDSYENLDQETAGENADGFAAKLRIGPGQCLSSGVAPGTMPTTDGTFSRPTTWWSSRTAGHF